MNHIQRLAHEGKLVLAGPFIDGGEWRGIYIFDVASLAEAEALTASDPAVQAGSLTMELQAW
ncbi:YciI family protein [Shewanella algae]